MQISDLIRRLNAEYSEHGDIAVTVYINEPEREMYISAIEFNDDEEPVILLEVEDQP